MRDIALSLFPDLAPDRPVGPLFGSVQTGTNADLIATVAPTYLAGSVLDVTYGEGKWWERFRPDPFTFHDLHKVDGVDFRDLPHPDGSFDAVCFDPPYVHSGGKAKSNTVAEFRDRFGLDANQPGESFYALIMDGLAETARVTNCWLLVKCMEFAQGGKFHDVPHLVTVAASAMGLVKFDQVVHHTGPGPGGHNIFEQKRARRHHSYLLVFRKVAS